ncbi:MAG TPA: MBL fold metallo-hydrolase [Candidatus Binataceae bacterium]|nr:MBL fold metallo-hydrolase [Candidatus Binataceae bacterium]
MAGDGTTLIRFWGTRGSIPAPIGYRAVRDKIREALLAARGRHLESLESIESFIDEDLPFSVAGGYGGNTSCVELVTGGEEYVLCDLGTGVREFGNRVLAKHGPGKHHRFNVFLSHLHWDHIMGFPFFGPSYIPGNVIRIFGCHPHMMDAFVRQQSHPCFPVDFRSLGATIEFVSLEPGRIYDIDGLTVQSIQQNHPSDSYGFRFSRDGKTVVFSTDCEHKFQVLNRSYPFIDFFREADLLIFDAQYSLADQMSVKEDWGHSSNMIAVELAQLAQVKHLVLYHHEPMLDDRMLEKVLEETRNYAVMTHPARKLTVTSAYDGLEIVI